MTDDAYRRRVEHLAEEYLTRSYPPGRHHPFDDGWGEWRYALDHLRQADEVLQFLRRSERDPYKTITTIDETLDDAHSGLRRAQQDLRWTGYLDLLDDHIDTVMRGLDPANLPAEESAVLRMLGFPELADTIHASLELLGQEWRNGTAKALRVDREFQITPASSSIDNAVNRIDQHRQERRTFAAEERRREDSQRPSEETAEPRKGRKWWKGLGQIVEGTAVALADAGMAFGALHVPVSDETRTYGAVISVSGGIGKIMGGLGDLWGE